MIILDVYSVPFQRCAPGRTFRADDHGEDPTEWIVWFPG